MSSMSTPTLELRNEIAKVEATLLDLKAQMRQITEAEQHDAIDHLEDYLERADHKAMNLKEFAVMIMAELRAVFLGGQTKDTGHLKL